MLPAFQLWSLESESEINFEVRVINNFGLIEQAQAYNEQNITSIFQLAHYKIMRY